MPETIVTQGEVISAWIAVGLTLLMFSFLYKDNPLFRLGEHLYVGLTVGYGLVYAWFNIIWPDLVNPLYRVAKSTLGKQLDFPLEDYETWWLIIPLVLSILMLMRFSSKLSWLSRWSFAFITGAVSGMTIPLVVSADIFKQIVPTLQPLYQPADTLGKTIADTSGIIIILVGVIAVLIYFFFSTEHKGPIKVIARVGIFYMMISFGAAFGYTVMGRETLAIARFQYLVDWSAKKYYYASIILLVVIIVLLVLFELFKKKQKLSPPA
jgi:hypothetical protein